MALNLAESSPQEDLQASDLAYQIKKGPHPLSPPDFLMELPLNYSVSPIPSIPELTITRIAHDPEIFHLENVSSMEDHLSLMEHASNQGMTYSGTKSGDIVKQRVNSYTAWIYPDEGDADNRALNVADFMTDVFSHLLVREELKGSTASTSYGIGEDSNDSMVLQELGFPMLCWKRKTMEVLLTTTKMKYQIWQLIMLQRTKYLVRMAYLFLG